MESSKETGAFVSVVKLRKTINRLASEGPESIVKNIVVCCDGTMGKYDSEDENTNVVRLFERLDKDGEKQISFYDPGVGTHSFEKNIISRRVDKAKMAAFGTGIRSNIEDAYRYLMDQYEPEDKVFLFGYSRGAYTVRALAGMLHKCGLLTKGSNNLVPYATRVYKGGSNEVAAGFKNSFSRECKPHFIGVWDTVASIGWLWWRTYFSNQRLNGDVSYGYQALSVDEKRGHFQVAIWDENDIAESQTIEQVWFPGFHADVGGQKADRCISDITLQWMLRQARARGLKLRDAWEESLHPNPSGEIKPSHRNIWQLLPQSERRIPEGAKIHLSVLQRMKDPNNRYIPNNLPGTYTKVD